MPSRMRISHSPLSASATTIRVWYSWGKEKKSWFFSATAALGMGRDSKAAYSVSKSSHPLRGNSALSSRPPAGSMAAV